MKTIEERAKECSEGYDDDGYSAGIYTGYVEGARFQKSIDIDNARKAFNKACGWLSVYPWYNEVMETFIDIIEK